MRLEDLRWDNEFARKCAMEGGSKIGFDRFARQSKALRPYLLPTIEVPPGEDTALILAKSPLDKSRTYVVRGGDPRDMVGLVDVIRTEIDVLGAESEVIRAVDEVRASVKNGARSFFMYEWGVEPEEPGVIVQPYIRGWHGSLAEHPHTPGIYHLSVIDSRGIHLFEEVFTENGDRIDTDTGQINDRDSNVPQHIPQEAINVYRMVRESGFVPASHSFQMEFVMDKADLYALQARLFRPFEPAAEFRVPPAWGEVAYYGVYGITPPEGVTVTAVPLTKEAVDRFYCSENVGYVYAPYGPHASTSLDVQPKKMAVYFAPSRTGAILEHGHYRWVQKAPLAVTGNLNDLRPLCEAGGLDMTDEKMMRKFLRRFHVTSNGREGYVRKIEPGQDLAA